MNIVFTENEQTIKRFQIDELIFLPSVGESVILNDNIYKVVNIIADLDSGIIMFVCEEG